MKQQPELPRFKEEEPERTVKPVENEDVHGWELLSPEQQEELDKFNRRVMK